MNSKDLIRLLQKNGWTRARQSGSHVVFVKPGCRNIIVPVHSTKDLPTGTLNAILKQAGLKGN